MRALLGDRRQVVALVIASLLSGVAESAIVALVVQSATALVNHSTRVRIDLGPLHGHATLGALFGLAFALALVRLALGVVISVVPARISANMQHRLRTELFAAFTRASWGVQSRDGEGYLQELMVNQVAQATVGALAATTLVVALLTFVVLILSAFVLNFVAAIVVLAAAIGLFAVLRPLSDRTRQRAHETSTASVTLAGGVNEAVRVAEETRVFGTDAAQRRRLDALITQVQVPYFHVQFLARLVPGIYQSLVYVLIVGALAAVYASGTNHVASLGAVVLLLVRAGTYGQAVQSSYQSARAAVPFAERVDEARRRYVADTRSSGTRRLGALRALAFDRVTFGYERDSPVLCDIDFGVASGEAVGIVGPSGAGKSTMVQILLRLRGPDSGRYLVNGMVADEIDSEEWHRRVAYVPQEPRLLHASVADNIRFFRDFDDGDVQRAARLAAIHDEIVSWPDGYDTIVGPRADAVSGGQQQRICIARALVTQPDVLVLDEPTSALDPHSELTIQQSLATLKGTLTLFVVAHRMSTLDMCERVMVIVDGRLQAFDTPARLEGSNGYFRSASVLAARPSATG